MNEITIFNFSLSSVSALRTIGAGKLKSLLSIEADRLPEMLRPMLVQNVLDPKDFSPFEKMRKRVQHFLRKKGVFDPLFGWVINNDSGSVDEVMDYMEGIKTEFYEEKAALVASYGARCEDRLEYIREQCSLSNYPCEDLVNLIRESQPRVEHLENSINFKYLKPRRVEILSEEQGGVLEGIYGNALAEIESRALRALKSKGTKAHVKAVIEIQGKCQSLTYFDDRFSRMVSEISSVISPIGLKKDDEYQAHESLAVHGLLGLLANGKSLREKIETGQSLIGFDAQADDEDVQTIETLDAEMADEVEPETVELEVEAMEEATGSEWSLEADALYDYEDEDQDDLSDVLDDLNIMPDEEPQQMYCW